MKAGDTVKEHQAVGEGLSEWARGAVASSDSDGATAATGRPQPGQKRARSGSGSRQPRHVAGAVIAAILPPEDPRLAATRRSSSPSRLVTITWIN